jgi:hypothetical protein
MGIIDEVKSVAEIARQAGNLPLYERLLGLQKDALEMQEQLANLKREKDNLSEALARREALVRQGDKYFYASDSEQKEGPVCHKCYVDSGRISLLVPSRGRVGATIGSVLVCKHCQSQY